VSRSVWWGIALFGLALEGAALYYQYVLNYGPCVLCIHVRLWLFGIVGVALAGALFSRQPRSQTLLWLVMLVPAIGFAERSWQVLAVERGWSMGACSMDPGLPRWFAVDRWFPVLFEPWEACGYTPEILLGITMAETLMGLSVMLVILVLAFLALTGRQLIA